MNDEVIREWVLETISQNHQIMEQQLRAVVRPRPVWLPNRIWRWTLRRLVYVEETRRTGNG